MALSDQQAPSSNSSYPSSTRNWKFDVFLSFKGEDTRRGFTDHLYVGLCRKGFRVFRDDEELERGEVISRELLQAIEDSRFAIVIVSKNYASSSWCLDELQHILASRNDLGQQVLPIFYHVDPSDVRHQRKSFAKAFAMLEDKFKEDERKVQKWRDSLTYIANLSGWDSKYWHETELIERVAGELWTKLRCSFPTNNDILIGIDKTVHQLESHLEIGLNDVRFVGIWGLGGVSKTTIARAVFEKFRSQFNICCFLANVRTTLERDGEVHLQRKLLSHLKIRNMEIEDTYEGKTTIQTFCCNKKVLLILDDVSSIIHLQNLAESSNWFGAGSRVIVTTRDLHLLKAHGVHEVYEVKTMCEDESLQLFCQKAFKSDKPPEVFLELSKSVCDYTGGLPLALSVLGSFFCGRSVLEWEDALDMLKKDPNKDILQILRISYDALSSTEKAIFLDIACFFNHKIENKIKQILKSCGLNSTIGISTLIEKSLLKVSSGKYLEMHDLLEQMGRNIVFEESPHDAGRRSRLWLKEDIDIVLEKNMGTKIIQGVVSNTSCRACWDPEAFSSICNLILLIISWDIKLPHGLKSLPSTLKVLHWAKYPLDILPFGTQLAQLVDLKMHHSKLKQLWNKSQGLGSLKFLDLSHSKYFIKTPNFSELPNLEVLELEGCVALVDLHPSVGNHRKIEVLNLKGCKNLKALPRKLEMTSLKEFVLCGCNQVRYLPEFSEVMKNLVTLDVGETSVVKLPESLGLLTSLETLNLTGCKSLVCLPHNIHNLKCLKVLDISGCSKFSKLPENLNENEAMEKLDVSGTAIIEVPSSIGHLEKLKTLSFHGCKTPNSWILSSLLSYMFQRNSFSKSLILPSSIFNLKSLRELDLSYCNIDDESIPDDLGGLLSLQRLNLSGNMFVNLPAISNLLKLAILELNCCPRLQTLPQALPGLNIIEAAECASLETLTTEQLLHFSDVVEQGPYICYGLFPWRPMKETSVIIPGREIPPWFENQSDLCLNEKGEASLIIDISPGEYQEIALCTALDDDIFYTSEDCQTHFDGPAYQPTWWFDFNKAGCWIPRSCQPRSGMKSPHLWIVFWQFKTTKHGQTCLELKNGELRNGVQGTQKLDGKVSIKCGWHVITKGDLEKWGIAMNQTHLPIWERFTDDVFKENTMCLEAEKQERQLGLSLNESSQTIDYEGEIISPKTPSLGSEEEDKLDDSWMQFITDDARYRI